MKFSITARLALILSILPAIALAQDDSVLIQRGDAVITQSEFDARIGQIPAHDRRAFLRDWKRVRDILSQMLIKDQLALDAEAAGYDLEPQGQAAAELGAKNALADSWLMEYVARHPDADYEALARETYLASGSGFNRPETVDVTHILISAATRSSEEALELAESLAERVAADPTVFDGLVAEYSDDPSAPANQGRFTGVRRGQMVPQFDAAAFEMRESGSIAGPVETRFGYHLIRLDAYHPAGKMTFEEIRPRLEEQARRDHLDRVRTEYLSSIGKRPADISEEGVFEMLGRYFSEQEIEEIKAAGVNAGQAR